MKFNIYTCHSIYIRCWMDWPRTLSTCSFLALKKLARGLWVAGTDSIIQKKGQQQPELIIKDMWQHNKGLGRCGLAGVVGPFWSNLLKRMKMLIWMNVGFLGLLQIKQFYKLLLEDKRKPRVKDKTGNLHTILTEA